MVHLYQASSKSSNGHIIRCDCPSGLGEPMSAPKRQPACKHGVLWTTPASMRIFGVGALCQSTLSQTQSRSWSLLLTASFGFSLTYWDSSGQILTEAAGQSGRRRMRNDRLEARDKNLWVTWNHVSDIYFTMKHSLSWRNLFNGINVLFYVFLLVLIEGRCQTLVVWIHQCSRAEVFRRLSSDARVSLRCCSTPTGPLYP